MLGRGSAGVNGGGEASGVEALAVIKVNGDPYGALDLPSAETAKRTTYQEERVGESCVQMENPSWATACSVIGAE